MSARKSDGGAEDAKQAAKAFVQRFLTAHDDAMASGDFSAVKAMSTKDCSNCQMAVSYFGKLYSDGGKVEGGTFTEPKVTVTEASQESAVVAVKTTVSEYKIVTAEGAGEKYPAKPSDSTFTLAKGSDGRWRVANWTYD